MNLEKELLAKIESSTDINISKVDKITTKSEYIGFRVVGTKYSVLNALSDRFESLEKQLMEDNKKLAEMFPSVEFSNITEFSIFGDEDGDLNLQANMDYTMDQSVEEAKRVMYLKELKDEYSFNFKLEFSVISFYFLGTKRNLLCENIKGVQDIFNRLRGMSDLRILNQALKNYFYHHKIIDLNQPNKEEIKKVLDKHENMFFQILNNRQDITELDRIELEYKVKYVQSLKKEFL